jgi:glycosyltransferase involved in cell wall biosynthesis
MRIVVAQNMFHLPAHGGANKANRILSEELAARGHECHVVAPLTGALRGSDVPALEEYLAQHGVTDIRPENGVLTYRFAGVHGHAVIEPSHLARAVRRTIADVEPDRVVVPSDDPGGMVLAAALAAAPGRVVYIAYTIQQLPFGPAAFYPSEAGTRLLRRTAGIVSISRAIQDYLMDGASLPSALIHPSVYAPIPSAVAGDGAFVTMVNPCAYKGIDIFLPLAASLSGVPFLAVPTWGATAEDRTALASRPNITVLPPADDIDDVLRRTKVLVMPSLWDETFGFTCIDAMLRGIPVVASGVAGLVEAKLGVPYLLPVRRIEAYDVHADPARPVPSIPPQDIGPWTAAVRRLLDDPQHYADIAARSRSAALAFVESLDAGALERFLSEVSIAGQQQVTHG